MMEEARKKGFNAEHHDLERKALSLLDKKMWRLAADAYSACINLNSLNHRAFVGRSECYFELREFNLSHDDSCRAIQLIQDIESKIGSSNVYCEVIETLNQRKKECLKKV